MPSFGSLASKCVSMRSLLSVGGAGGDLEDVLQLGGGVVRVAGQRHGDLLAGGDLGQDRAGRGGRVKVALVGVLAAVDGAGVDRPVDADGLGGVVGELHVEGGVAGDVGDHLREVVVHALVHGHGLQAAGVTLQEDLAVAGGVLQNRGG